MQDRDGALLGLKHVPYICSMPDSGLDRLNATLRCQLVCKVSSTPEACGAAVAVRSGRCPVRAQGSKVRFADHAGVSPQVGLIVLLAETVAGSAPHPEMAGLQRDGCIRG